MRIAVVGAGALGLYFGGRLAEAGEDVAFLARGRTLEALRTGGLRIDSIAGDFTLERVEATDQPAAIGPVDAVLVCVKAWQVPEVAPTLRPLLREGTAVIPLQNGIDAPDQLAAALGAGFVLGGLCRIFAFQTAPGRVRHAGVAPSLAFGELDGGSSERVERLKEVFLRAKGVSVDASPNIRAAMWEKLLFIVALSTVGAATRSPAGVFRAIPETRRLLESVLREILDVARAKGIALADGLVARTLGFIDGLPADATASMQRDLVEGRPSELEAQTGAVVRLGLETGVATPVSATLYAALLPGERSAREKG
jgi:2-dehydropantoate 2-reductase